MSIRYGAQLVCDRCGVLRFGETIGKIVNEGWTVNEDERVLCPFCSILYKNGYRGKENHKKDED